jgi:hypothetical protein
VTPKDVSEAQAGTDSAMTELPSTGPMRTVRLPEEVVRALEQRMRGSSFESVDLLIAFILSRLVDHTSGGGAFTEEDERMLKDRLRSLGYID